MTPQETLRHHVTGAIERGEKSAIIAFTHETIWTEACAAAQAAAELENSRIGTPEAARGFDCGFAWVVFDPARQPIAKYLKKLGHADKHWSRGYYVWYSKLHSVSTQSVSVHEAAARAAAVVFQKHGAKCYVGSRLD